MKVKRGARCMVPDASMSAGWCCSAGTKKGVGCKRERKQKRHIFAKDGAGCKKDARCEHKHKQKKNWMVPDGAGWVPDLKKVQM